jgi:nucleoside triphosphatase
MPVDQKLLAALDAFPHSLRIRMEQVEESETRRQPKDGDFALIEHLCHLRDYEIEGCQERIARMLSEEMPALRDFEGVRLAVERKYLEQDMGMAAREFDDARRATLALLGTLTDEQLARRARFGAAEEISVNDLVAMVVEHDATHLQELDALLAALRSERTDMSRRPAPRVVVVAVARDRDRVLLCRMPENRGVFPGLWSLPGGGVEPGESLSGALAREVREELGVELASATPRLFKDLLHEKISPSRGVVPVYMVFQIYECRLSSTDLKLNEEFTEYVWARPSELAGLAMSDVTRATLESLGVIADAETEILAAIDGFRGAYESGDLARLADYYCDDILKLRQGASAETKGVLLARLAAVMQASDRKLEVDNEEIRVRGDLAVVRGRFVVTLTPREGSGPVQLARRFLEVWCRHTGRWAVCRTMDNAETA